MLPRVRIYPVSLGLSRLNVCRWCAASAATSALTIGGRMTSADPSHRSPHSGWNRPTRPAKRRPSLEGRTPGWTNGCAAASSSCLTAPWCGRYERPGATGDSPRRCCETSPQVATDSTGSLWTSSSPPSASWLWPPIATPASSRFRAERLHTDSLWLPRLGVGADVLFAPGHRHLIRHGAADRQLGLHVRRRAGHRDRDVPDLDLIARVSVWSLMV
jgi:hypothetical protein